ncbi:hypothetical protein Tco_0524787 [Tanacetum coccineum]
MTSFIYIACTELYPDGWFLYAVRKAHESVIQVSTATSMYLLPLEDGNGPMKSMPQTSKILNVDGILRHLIPLPKESGIKELFSGEFAPEVPVGPLWAVRECQRASLPVTHTAGFIESATEFEQEGVIPEFAKSDKTMGYFHHEEQTIQSDERKCFRDFLVLEFILMRVLKSGKMIGGQILCSFLVSDDNIEFLEQKDPPHQSWLRHPFY